MLSAHGLPLKIVQAGDPYPQEVAATAEAVVAALGVSKLDWKVCYHTGRAMLECVRRLAAYERGAT